MTGYLEERVFQGFEKTTGGEPEVLAPHFQNESGGWVLQRETVTNRRDHANQPVPSSSASSSLTNRRIVLVGASVRWAAQSATKAGFSVIGMDRFGDTDTRCTCEAFYQIPPEHLSNAELLRQKTDTVAKTHQARQSLVGGLGPLTDNLLCDEPSKHKAETVLLSRLCEGLEISVPKTVTNCQDDPRRWLVKRYQSCGGLGVRFWNRSDIESRNAIESGEAFRQQFISGHRYGLVAIANGQTTHLLGMTRSLRQRVGSRPFVYSGSIGPCWDLSVPADAMAELSRRVAAEYSLRGLFNLDFIRDRRGQWWLLELNARPSGSCEIIERAAWQSGGLNLSQSLMGLHIDALGDKPVCAARLEMLKPNGLNSLHLKQIVYARHAGRFRTPDSLDGIADVPNDHTLIEAGHPIATSISLWKKNRAPLWKTLRTNTKQLREMTEPPGQS